jgi:hypothetical protein
MPSALVGAVEPVRPDLVGALVGVVVGEIDGRCRLSRHLHHPTVAPSAQARRFAPPSQLGNQRLGPEVLVDVDLHALVKGFSESFK